MVHHILNVFLISRNFINGQWFVTFPSTFEYLKKSRTDNYIMML